MRGKRYALVIEDGKVKEAHVEPDNTGTNGNLPPNCYFPSARHLSLANVWLVVSLAEKVLG